MTVKYRDQKETLKLGADMYSYTFWKFVKADNPNILGGLMMKCYFTVVIQFFITILKYDKLQQTNPIYLGSTQLNTARVICAYIMHM